MPLARGMVDTSQIWYTMATLPLHILRHIEHYGVPMFFPKYDGQKWAQKLTRFTGSNTARNTPPFPVPQPYFTATCTARITVRLPYKLSSLQGYFGPLSCTFLRRWIHISGTGHFYPAPGVLSDAGYFEPALGTLTSPCKESSLQGEILTRSAT